MEYPYLSKPKQLLKSLTAFGGYNPQEHCLAGEWYDMENLSATRAPLASPRPPRGQVGGLFEKGGNLIAKNLLWVVQNRDLVGFNPETGQVVHTFPQAFSISPQTVGFGSYLVDMRGGKWFSTLPDDNGIYQNGQFAYTLSPENQDFSVYLCDEAGEFFQPNHFGVSPPKEPVGGMLWLDTTQTPATLKRYYEDTASFLPLPTYLRITLYADTSVMQEGDMVEVSLPSLVDADGNTCKMYEDTLSKKVITTGENPNGSHYFVVKGELNGCVGYSRFGNTLTLSLGQDITQGIACSLGQIRVENPLPLLDFVVECGNRLWGCRFGTNRKGEQVNEIYASALGSFRVWEKFEGIADDSYTLSCGTDGPFTAAAVYGGNPLFFKENYLHRVYGTFPFSVTPTPCNGVKKGFGGSVQVVNNTLYYLSRGGICAYNGAAPRLLNFPLSGEYSFGVAGGNQTHYYLFLQGEQGGELLVYHTQKGIFTKESTPFLTAAATLNNEIYACVSAMEGKQVICLTKANTTPLEQQVEWYGVSGQFGVCEKKGRTLIGLELALTLPENSTFSVKVQYNDEESWHSLLTLQGGHGGYFTLPLRLRPCRTFRLKLYGKGDFTLHALHQTLQEGRGEPCI